MSKKRQSEPDVTLERRERYAVVTIRNEDKRNAINLAMLSRLREIFTNDLADLSVRCVMIRGAGTRAFSSGFDLDVLQQGLDSASLGQMGAEEDPASILREPFGAIVNYHAPVVAYMNGHAFGAGLELAVSCDFRITRPGSLFGMPPARLGLVYEPEGLLKFVRLMGHSHTRRMFLTGDRIDADTALHWGLVDEIHPEKESEEAAMRITARIAANAPKAVRGLKRTLNLLSGYNLPDREKLEELRGIRNESMTSQDFVEGLSAFLARREPDFKDE